MDLGFIPKHQIGLCCSDTRKGFLTLENKVLIETVNICETGPQLMTYSSLNLPPRTLAVINVYAGLKGNSAEQAYKVKPNCLLMDQYPNVAVIPVIHITPMWTDIIIPFIVVNLSIKSIFLSKCDVFGIFRHTGTEICKIMTSLALEPLALDLTSEHSENLLPYREGQFYLFSS